MRYELDSQTERPELDGVEAAQRRWLLSLGLVLGFWTFFSFFNANQIFFGMRYEGMRHSWWRILIWQLLVWNIWTCFAPLIIRVGRRFPLERSSWARSLLIHLPFSLLLSAVHIFFFVSLTVLIEPFDIWTNTAPFMEQFLKSLRGWMPIEFIIYGATLGVGYAFDYYDKYREREFRATQLEAQLAQAELKSLKMQLHPHFLFNTLNGIASLVRDNKNKAAVSMIVGLSDLLRHALENAGKQEVPLREELDFLELYLDIQQMRFPDRLKVRMEIQPETLAARVPNLILQPLVENAIRHGIAQRVSAGLVAVTARNEDGLLRINVYDDGPGLQKGWRMEESDGIGLANTRERLQQLYGAEHRFDVRNREEGGVEATLLIPLRLGASEI
ncbi:MAG: histidine kinase [Pyrinomonadaceae bacterium]